MSETVPDATISCPHCSFQKTETMPTDACQWFYECTHCHQILNPKAGDCACTVLTEPCLARRSNNSVVNCVAQ